MTQVVVVIKAGSNPEVVTEQLKEQLVPYELAELWSSRDSAAIQTRNHLAVALDRELFAGSAHELGDARGLRSNSQSLEWLAARILQSPVLILVIHPRQVTSFCRYYATDTFHRHLQEVGEHGMIFNLDLMEFHPL